MIRYRFVEKTSLVLLEYLHDFFPDLLNFPLNIVKIIKSIDNYKIWSYQYYSKTLNIPIEDVIACCESNSGCTFKDNYKENYLILFNKNMVLGRQSWTLAHELGHCQLNHFNGGNFQQIASNSFILKNQDPDIEQEADYFAATLLSPLPLFKYLHIQSSLDVEKVFGLSTQASINRYKDYLIWQKSHCRTAIDNGIIRTYSHLTNNE